MFVIADAILATGDFLSCLNQWVQRIGLPDRVNTLYKSQNSLKTCTSINTWLRQWGARSVRRLVVLHEHQVPELHEAIAMRIILWTTIRTKIWATVVMNL